MSNKKLFVLAILAAVSVILAVRQSRIANKPRAKSTGPKYLIQGLDPAAIDSVDIRAGENTVTIKRRGGKFVVAEKDNYPVVMSQLNDTITKLMDIETVELYTSDKSNHKDLGITEEDAEMVVKFFTADSELLTGVVVGRNKEAGLGSYVRRVTDDEVYVTLNKPWLRTDATDYIDQQLISINRQDIAAVTVTSPNDAYVLKADPNGGRVVLENAGVDEKLKASESDQVFNALASLQFEDVSSAASMVNKLNFDRRFVCTLKDSTVYTLEVAKDQVGTYVSCRAEYFDQALVTQQDVKDSNEAQLKAKEAKFLARDKANQFTAKHKGWAYNIPENKAKSLTTELTELFEVPVETQTPTTAK
ncbi:DUF4340 domain-containing protein [Planctomycetota bacterium]